MEKSLTSEKYKEVCGYNVDMTQLLDNIKFFYAHKGNTEVYIKTVDTALEDGRHEEFYRMFENYCDSINIEYTIPLFKDVDYSNIIKRDRIIPRYDSGGAYQHVCQIIFYSLFVRPNGDVIPCCVLPEPVVLGNILDESLEEIWNGEKRKQFLRLHLNKKRELNLQCKNCVQPTLSSEPLDYLDDDADEILKKL